MRHDRQLLKMVGIAIYKFGSDAKLWSYANDTAVVFQEELLTYVYEHPSSLQRISKDLKKQGFVFEELLDEMASRRINNKLEDLLELAIETLHKEGGSHIGRLELSVYPIMELQVFKSIALPKNSLKIAHPLVYNHRAKFLRPTFEDKRNQMNGFEMVSIKKPYSMNIPKMFHAPLINALENKIGWMIRHLIML